MWQNLFLWDKDSSYLSILLRLFIYSQILALVIWLLITIRHLINKEKERYELSLEEKQNKMVDEDQSRLNQVESNEEANNKDENKNK
jgi:hypothetical protein